MSEPVPLSIPIRMPTKDPTAVYDYALDFTEELADPEMVGITITSVSWSVLPVDGDTTPLAVAAHEEPPDLSSSEVRLVAGSRFTDYLVRCARTFSDGEADVVSFALLVDYT